MKNRGLTEKAKFRLWQTGGLAVIISAIIALLLYSNIAQRDHQKSAENQAGYRKISAEEAKKIMDTAPSAVILDVRTKEEHAESRIARSTLLPYTEIEARAPSILPDKDAQILVYCRRGRRSQIAANALLSMGYKNVLDFGGLDTWGYGTVRE